MEKIALDQRRARSREQLAADRLDVLVIGGGIVGAGVARDAALRGLRTGLVEQHDLAFGTSSRSSRLLHGGLRYLAQGRIGLVYEASREKRVLHRIAPHLSLPLRFLFPTYRRSGWPRWKLAIGVKLYDLLCGGKNLGPSAAWSREGALRELPGLRAEGLTGAVSYFDALTQDARLVLDTLRSAHRAGAIVQNYVRVEEAQRDGDGWRCRLRDAPSDEEYDITARTVVHATGPWAEKLAPSSVRLRLTKGVHLVVERERLGGTSALVMAEGSRIVFAIPWGRRWILGTTDTDYDGPIEAVRTEAEDVAYLLDVVNTYFPDARLGPSDVLATWAGLRPLVDAGKGGPSDISRAHEIRVPEPGWLDVAGGKLTTYRLIGQQAVDRVCRLLGQSGRPCRTADERLLPAGEVEGLSGLLPPPVSAEAVYHYCDREWAVHLDDVMIRRTSWHYYLDDADRTARQVAQWMAQAFAWDGGRHEAELARYRAALH